QHTPALDRCSVASDAWFAHLEGVWDEILEKHRASAPARWSVSDRDIRDSIHPSNNPGPRRVEPFPGQSNAATRRNTDRFQFSRGPFRFWHLVGETNLGVRTHVRRTH